MFATNKKALLLLEAIKEHEGWSPPCEDNNFKGSRSYRQHNPGNLRRSPFAFSYVDNFAVFISDEVGNTALLWDIYQKATGNTVTSLNGTSTIRELITVYAPPSDDNNTEAYINMIVVSTGMKETTTLAEIFEL